MHLPRDSSVMDARPAPSSRLGVHSDDTALHTRDFFLSLRAQVVSTSGRPLEIELEMIEDRWLSVRLAVMGYEVNAAASLVFNDPVADLLDVAYFVAGGDLREHQVPFWEEPDAYVLMVAPKSECVEIGLSSVTRGTPGVRLINAMAVASETVTRIRFGKAVMRAVQRWRSILPSERAATYASRVLDLKRQLAATR